MTSHFLKTKFHIPAWRTGAVSRPRLLARLNKGLDEGHRLTLVSAPAGYGKTTLMAEWIYTLANSKEPDVRVACLALDEGDNDPARFLGYFISALQSAEENFAQGVLGLLGIPQLPPLPAIFDEIINELAESPYRIILVLDDYHLINNVNLHEALEYFIEHRPSCFHLAITTRQDPPFSLARMRARGQMTEIRAHELRFTPQEACQFFDQSMHLSLETETINALETRTEGWAAGLQLAALALQNLPDQKDFLADFSGSHRYIIDYLLDEVLKRQPPEISEFLSKTSALKRFNADLCQAVTGNAASGTILTELERCNLFLVSLDNQRGWYRYHHLFAEVLRAGLAADTEQAVRANAARWFESQGLLTEALPYWLAVPDVNEAKRLISDLAVDLIKNGELQTLLGWLNSLPEQVVNHDPDLVSYKALSLLMTGQINLARDYVAQANQTFEHEIVEAGHGRLLSIQAWFAMTVGESRTGDLAKAALAQLDESDLFFRILTLIALGNYYEWNASLPAACDIFLEAWHLGKQLNHPFIALGALTNLAFNLLDQGQLCEAEAHCRSALAEYVDRRGKQLPIAGMIYMPLASICYEKGDFEEAQFFAQTGSELCERLFSSSIMGKDNDIVLSRIAFQRGNVKQAFELVQSAAESARQNHMMMVVYKMAIVQVELYLLAGSLDQAEIGLKELDSLVQSSLPKGEHVVSHLHAIYWASSGQPEKAFKILERLEQVDREEGSLRRMLGVYITKALIYQKLSHHEEARRIFEIALRLAAPQGYKVAFFPHRNRQTQHLLQAVRSIAPAFVDSILKATRPDNELSAKLPDPLSEQEMRVLSLIVGGKSNQEIAEELVISPGTAKWHVHNILQKLEVNNRAQAIARARELGME